jgi:D-sedoheptulose 7-phosphate isomerase
MYFKNYFLEIYNKTNLIIHNDLLDCVERIKITVADNKKLIIVGNGGSAAIASHVSVDFVKAASIRAINFNESDLITCFGNDYGYENWVKEALKAYADSGDLVILISSSGKSPNIINAAKFCNEIGLDLITLSGFDTNNQLRQLGNINLWVDSTSYNVVEMTHHIWLLAILDFIIDNKVINNHSKL